MLNINVFENSYFFMFWRGKWWSMQKIQLLYILSLTTQHNFENCVEKVQNKVKIL